MDNKFDISDYVYHRLPLFIKEDYNKFSSLIKSYYAWLSVDYEETKYLYSLLDHKMIYSISELEADKLLKDFGVYDIFSSISFERKKSLLLSINELYSMKGTRSFIEIMFKFLGIDASVFNPRDRLFTLSNTPYYKNLKYVETSSYEFDILTDGLSTLTFNNIDYYPVNDIYTISPNRIRIIFECSDTLSQLFNDFTLFFENGEHYNLQILETKSLSIISNSSQNNVNLYENITDADGLIVGNVTKVSSSKIKNIAFPHNILYSDYALIYDDFGLIGYYKKINETYTISLFKFRKYFKAPNLYINNNIVLDVEFEWYNDEDPGKPLSAFTAIDLNEFYIGNILTESGAILEPSVLKIVDLPETYGTKLFNSPSYGNAFFQDSDKWQQYSRGISIPNDDLKNVPSSIINHISQVGVNVFIDIPDRQLLNLSSTISYKKYNLQIPILVYNSILRSQFGFEKIRVISDLTTPVRKDLSSIINYNRSTLTGSLTPIILLSSDINVKLFSINNTVDLSLASFDELNTDITYKTFKIDHTVDLTQV